MFVLFQTISERAAKRSEKTDLGVSGLKVGGPLVDGQKTATAAEVKSFLGLGVNLGLQHDDLGQKGYHKAVEVLVA